MSKNSVDAYGAEGKTNLLMFDPEALHIVTDPEHPLYDERAALPVSESLIRNIQHHGVLQPVVINKNTETGVVEVVAGRQRVKAAREANNRLRAQGLAPIMVPAVPRKGDGADLAGVMVSENELRDPDTIMVRAAKMNRLRQMGRDDESIAVIFGVNPATVVNTLALLDCGQAVRKAVEAGQINVTDARYLARLSPSQQTTKVAELVAAGVGVKGHAKARAQRAVMAPVKAGPAKLKTRKEILRAYLDAKGRDEGQGALRQGYLDALAWVLGGEPAEEPVDTKTKPLFEEAVP
jgi:ParB family chromosome partitioning protein